MDFPTSIAYVSRSLEVYREIGDPVGAARQLNNLGWANSIPNPDAARAFFEEALEISRDSGAGDVIGNALLGAATILIRAGRIEEGREGAAAAVTAFEAAGERYLHVFALLDLGRVEDLERRPEAALARYAEALEMASHVGEGAVICTSLGAIANLLIDHGRDVLAVQLAAAIERRLGAMGGATTVEMMGLEPPMQRAAREVDPSAFGRASSDEEALTMEDAIREALAFARRVGSGLDALDGSA
jgi:tetratricopeptide (TPR) repeat protein